MIICRLMSSFIDTRCPIQEVLSVKFHVEAIVGCTDGLKCDRSYRKPGGGRRCSVFSPLVGLERSNTIASYLRTAFVIVFSAPIRASTSAEALNTVHGLGFYALNSGMNQQLQRSPHGRTHHSSSMSVDQHTLA